MINNPLLSIVIPTRNRHYCLNYTIQIVLSCYSNLEIIILDSSVQLPDENLKKFLENHQCKYIRTPISFNAVQNFNESLKYINGDYVIFMGDDDIITDKVGFVLNYMQLNSIDSLITTFPINYNWPGFKTRFRKEKLSGSLVIKKFTNKFVEINTHDEERKVIKKLIAGPLNLPRLYLGIVSSSLIKEAVNKYGNLFGGVSPDIYSSLLIGSLSKKCVQFDNPFIIPGAYKTSTSATSAAGKHKSSILGNDHTGRFPNLESQWNHNVPFIYTVQTVWSYSLIEAYKKIYQRDISDYSPLYSSLLPNILEFKNEIFKSFKKCVQEQKINYINILQNTFKNFVNKIVEKIFRKKIIIVQGFDNSFKTLEFLKTLNKVSE
jgi:glycosyltransferase involved in cell wall biosynthesis